MKYCSVVPKEVVQSLGNSFSKKPIGTGPFKFKRWDENIKLVCSINNIDFQSFKEKSSSNKVLNKYKQNTQLAYEFGVFGVPSFSVNENLFWGDDRLNDIVHLKKELNLV